MMVRLLLAALAFAILGVLLYMQQPERAGREATPASASSGEPGYVAIGAELVETGDDGQPLFRLDAERIAQPVPQGMIYLTAPMLQYVPPGGNPWVLTAEQGELPPDAGSADLRGAVQAQGKPMGSSATMRIDTDRLHVDMNRQLATTPDLVRVNWADSLLRGLGMRADLINGQLSLFKDVSGVLAH